MKTCYRKTRSMHYYKAISGFDELDEEDENFGVQEPVEVLVVGKVAQNLHS